MADLLALERWCNALPDRIERAANRLTIEATQHIAADLIAHTPVDITTAVSNWQASLNAPPVFGLPAIYPGRRGSTASQSRAAALGHVNRTLAVKDPGEKVYLSNLAGHIIDLNAGTSKQEPAGFIERGILVGRRYVHSQGFRY